jgi:shikimate dehydrogenase
VSRDTWPGAAEFRRLGATLVAWPGGDSSEFDDFVLKSGIIVQATSAGMHGASPGAAVAGVVPWPRLAPGVLAYDLVYNPAETEFLRAARAHGVRALGGLGMLVGQAALAFELWLGSEPPREAMRLAAVRELTRRSP